MLMAWSTLHFDPLANSTVNDFMVDVVKHFWLTKSVAIKFRDAPLSSKIQAECPLILPLNLSSCSLLSWMEPSSSQTTTGFLVLVNLATSLPLQFRAMWPGLPQL